MRFRTGVASFLVILAVIGGLGYVAWRSVSPKLPKLLLPLSQACKVTADGSVSLDTAQMANAATISAVGIRRGVPKRGVVVALATALQESKLRNVGQGDRDSVGLFQQRPSQDWGTPEEIADPRYSANAFYNSLLKVPGWQNLRVTEAAQAVQRSAYPEAYERWVDEAEVLADALAGDATSAVACTVIDEPATRGAAAAEALAAGLKLDWGTIRTANTANLVGVTLVATDTRAGWQYAHWLVAHADEQGVKAVRYAGQEWSAKSGDWSKSASAPAAGGGRVIAEVYAAA